MILKNTNLPRHHPHETREILEIRRLSNPRLLLLRHHMASGTTIASYLPGYPWREVVLAGNCEGGCSRCATRPGPGEKSAPGSRYKVEHGYKEHYWEQCHQPVAPLALVTGGNYRWVAHVSVHGEAAEDITRVVWQLRCKEVLLGGELKHRVEGRKGSSYVQEFRLSLRSLMGRRPQIEVLVEDGVLTVDVTEDRMARG